MTPLPAKSRAGDRRRARYRACHRKTVSCRGLARGLLDIEGELLSKSVEALADAGNTLSLHCDVSDARAVAAALAEIERRFGRLDALVNNAGVAVFAPLLETSDDDWSRALAVNLTGPFLCTKAAAPLIARTWRRGDRQHHLDLGGARLDAALRLRHQQGRARASHQATRRRTGVARHSRQRRRARPGRYRDGESRSHAGNPRRLSRCDSAQTATASKKSWRRRCSFCAATAQATSRGRFSPSMAASTPPASACRRCAASDGTGNISPSSRLSRGD